MNNPGGGPAFPVITSTDTVTAGPWASDPGMTLLDYFAGIAFQQAALDEAVGDVAAGRKALGMPEDAEWNYDVHWPMCVARKAYQHAEAMLAEKQRRQST